ncbi:MAG: peptide chain release factor N(5)-glutamine methyltransferase [Candidatus Omnitrophica bacterium]|nr:peptide chain release factor N(5)-glutamine methyltransferase [Candidatus Omnitrophota bacterium]
METLARPRDLIGELEARLCEAGITSARAEAEWLLADTLGMRRTELYLRDEPVASAQRESLQERLSRRLSGEPLQYVLGSCDFFGHRFAVSPGVFIPRPETETLAELAIEFLRRRAAPTAVGAPWVLELGTGSGCLAISLAKAVPTCIVVAVELSWMALQVARTNVITHRVEHRLRLVHTDWTTGIRGPVDMIVSNPPYVPDEEVRSLDGRTGDPALSLNGGRDGMAFHRRVLADAGQLLSAGGALLMECAEEQAAILQRLAEAQPWVKRVRIFDDLAARPRGLRIEANA